MSKTQVLLADHHALMRAVFCRIINNFNNFEVIAEASDGHTATHLTRRLKPKIALLDIHLPGMNGLNTTAQIRQKNPDTRIVILSLHTEKNYTLEAFHAGAMGYVSRYAFFDELESALHSVLKGEHWFSSIASRERFLQQRLLPSSSNPLHPTGNPFLPLVAHNPIKTPHKHLGSLP